MGGNNDDIHIDCSRYSLAHCLPLCDEGKRLMRIQWGHIVVGGIIGVVAAYLRTRSSHPSGNTQTTFVGR